MIDREIVEHVADLARIEVPAERREALVREMASIVRYVDQLRALDVANVPPLTHGVVGSNVYREDVAGPPLTTAESLAVAPVREGDFYRVPKIVGEA